MGVARSSTRHFLDASWHVLVSWIGGAPKAAVTPYIWSPKVAERRSRTGSSSPVVSILLCIGFCVCHIVVHDRTSFWMALDGMIVSKAANGVGRGLHQGRPSTARGTTAHVHRLPASTTIALRRWSRGDHHVVVTTQMAWGRRGFDERGDG